MLCERLGKTPAELGRLMTSAEITEFQALDELRHEETTRARLRADAQRTAHGMVTGRKTGRSKR